MFLLTMDRAWPEGVDRGPGPRGPVARSQDPGHRTRGLDPGSGSINFNYLAVYVHCSCLTGIPSMNLSQLTAVDEVRVQDDVVNVLTPTVRAS